MTHPQNARKRLRDALSRISQHELSRQSGIDQPVLSQIVRGKRNMSPKLAQALAAVLGQTPGYWLGEPEGTGQTF